MTLRSQARRSSPCRRPSARCRRCCGAGPSGTATGRCSTFGDTTWRTPTAALAAARAPRRCRRRRGARRPGRADAAANRIELLEVFLACGWLGAVAVPINTASMGPQIGYLLGDSGARLLVIEAGFVERLANAGLDETALEAIWVVDASAEGEARRRRRPPGWKASLRAHGPRRRAPPRRRDAGSAVEPAILPSDTLAILYTSGTTGPAKGVLCPHAQYHWWGVHSARILGVGADDVLCTTLPLFHINALNTFAQAALAGARVVYEPRFSASAFWPTMRARDATVIYLLGAMVPILLAQPVSAGGARAPRPHRPRPRRAGERRGGVPRAHRRAACSKATARPRPISSSPSRPTGRGPAAWAGCGRASMPASSTRNDVELPTGEAGELVLRADEPFAFASGYFGKPEATARGLAQPLVPHRRPGGPRGRRRLPLRRPDQGRDPPARREHLVVRGRAGAAEPSGGRRGRGLSGALGAGRGRGDGGRRRARGRRRSTRPSSSRFCRTRLPYFAIPRYVEVVADLPRTENGKVQKFRLRERGVTPAAWDPARAAPRERAI